MMRRSKKLGFSLIELMVVVSIIAILMALGAASYTTAQKKARDAKRRSDMRAVGNAFEQYYATNNSYADGCGNMATAEYLPAGLPSDPQPNRDDQYVFSCAVDSYCACSLLENETGNASDDGCTFEDGDYFCVKNQQ